LRNIDPDILDKITAKIEKFYEQMKEKHKENEDLKSLFQVQEVIYHFLQNKNSEFNQKLKPEMKHSNQQNKIVDWMVEKKLLRVSNLSDEKNKLFIEYGAGRAGLSSFVAERLKEHIKDDKSREK